MLGGRRCWEGGGVRREEVLGGKEVLGGGGRKRGARCIGMAGLSPLKTESIKVFDACNRLWV